MTWEKVISTKGTLTNVGCSVAIASKTLPATHRNGILDAQEGGIAGEDGMLAEDPRTRNDGPPPPLPCRLVFKA